MLQYFHTRRRTQIILKFSRVEIKSNTNEWNKNALHLRIAKYGRNQVKQTKLLLNFESSLLDLPSVSPMFVIRGVSIINGQEREFETRRE